MKVPKFQQEQSRQRRLILGIRARVALSYEEAW